MKKFSVYFFMIFLFFPFESKGSEFTKKGLFKKVQIYREKKAHRIISEFIDLLSIPNVSSDTENIRKNAVFIADYMKKHGVSSKIMETRGNPVGIVIVGILSSEISSRYLTNPRRLFP